MAEWVGVEAFVHVAELRSFRAAARVLGVTPAAISKAVAGLEARLGARLLHRTSRRVALTEGGEVYLRFARDAIDRLQAGEDALGDAGGAAVGRVSVSLSRVMADRVVARLGALRASHPGVQAVWSFSDREVSLAEEDVDIAVRIGDIGDRSWVARRLRVARWVTVASPAYLARRGAPARWQELADHELLRFARPRGGWTDLRFVEGGSVEVLRGGAAVVIDQGDLLVDAARAGLGVAQVFDFMVDEALAAGALVELFPAAAPPGPALTALTLPGRQRVPKVRAVLGFLSEVFGGDAG